MIIDQVCEPGHKMWDEASWKTFHKCPCCEIACLLLLLLLKDNLPSAHRDEQIRGGTFKSGRSFF